MEVVERRERMGKEGEEGEKENKIGSWKKKERRMSEDRGRE